MAGIPSRDEFDSLDEVIVEVRGVADNFGRSRFTAFWPTDQEWVPGGVRAQEFFADVDVFTDRALERGETVHVRVTQEVA